MFGWQKAVKQHEYAHDEGPNHSVPKRNIGKKRKLSACVSFSNLSKVEHKSQLKRLRGAMLEKC